jgi:hypothetical protein
LIWPAQEHVRRKILTSLSTQWTEHNDGLERELLYAGCHVPPAAFALNHEQLAFRYSESHQNSIGEQQAKSIHRLSPGQENTPSVQNSEAWDSGVFRVVSVVADSVLWRFAHAIVFRPNPGYKRAFR